MCAALVINTIYGKSIDVSVAYKLYIHDGMTWSHINTVEFLGRKKYFYSCHVEYGNNDCVRWLQRRTLTWFFYQKAGACRKGGFLLGRKEQKFKCNADSISVYSYVFVCTEREREREYLCVKKL